MVNLKQCAVQLILLLLNAHACVLHVGNDTQQVPFFSFFRAMMYLYLLQKLLTVPAKKQSLLHRVWVVQDIVY